MNRRCCYWILVYELLQHIIVFWIRVLIGSYFWCFFYICLTICCYIEQSSINYFVHFILILCQAYLKLSQILAPDWTEYEAHGWSAQGLRTFFFLRSSVWGFLCTLNEYLSDNFKWGYTERSLVINQVSGLAQSVLYNISITVIEFWRREISFIHSLSQNKKNKFTELLKFSSARSECNILPRERISTSNPVEWIS